MTRRFRNSNFPSCTFCFRQGFERAKLQQSTNLIRRSSAECQWKRLQSRLRHGMSHENKVLRSWKERAAYLGRGVRTVQRWEQLLGLPIKRQKAKAMGTVVASTDELDRWLLTGWAQRAIETNEKLRPSIDDYRRCPASSILSSRVASLWNVTEDLIEKCYRTQSDLVSLNHLTWPQLSQ